MSNNLFGLELGGIRACMTVSYQHGIKAQVSSRPAGTVDAILGFHPGNHHTGSAASAQLLGQPGHGKGIGPVFFKDHFTA